MVTPLRILIVGLLLSWMANPTAQRPVRRDLLVAAAACLSRVAPALSKALHSTTGIDVRFTFAG
jgi:ABC-type molybdate transport system substrate-binding protein